MRIFETAFCGQLIFCLADKSSIRGKIISLKFCLWDDYLIFFVFVLRFFSVCMLFNYIL